MSASSVPTYPEPKTSKKTNFFPRFYSTITGDLVRSKSTSSKPCKYCCFYSLRRWHNFVLEYFRKANAENKITHNSVILTFCLHFSVLKWLLVIDNYSNLVLHILLCSDFSKNDHLCICKFRVGHNIQLNRNRRFLAFWTILGVCT